MKKANIYLILSLFLNIILLFFGFRLVKGLGGIEFIKSHAIKKLEKSSQNVFSYKQKMSIFNNLPHRSNEIIFIGDSNIQYGEWNDLFENNHIRNRGISGDDIKGVTDRINEIIAYTPKKIFLMVGINNLINNHDEDNKVLADYENLIKLIRTKSPETKLYIHSLLPTYSQTTDMNYHISLINNKLNKLSHRYNATYINLYDSFKDTEGNLYAKYSFDGIHLNGNGYDVWKSKIQNFVNE